MHQHLILVINCGSSSLKFALYETNPLENENSEACNTHTILAEGLAESLNQEYADVTIKIESDKKTFQVPLLSEQENSHSLALKEIIDLLEAKFQLSQHLTGIGHRVVHGGKLFSHSVIINHEVLNQIKACVPLAPLHNPANITGIETLQTALPGIPQVAVFDTAFHQTMPDTAFTYAVPHSLYKNDSVRRYGFHGISHRYITQQSSNLLGKCQRELNLVTCHLGNGASVAAIRNGQSVDTSMGMTPLEGLVMGTRCGDLDPGIFDFLISKGNSPEKISHMLNKESGLLGISGISNDMRTICEHANKGHEASALALEVFCFRAAKHIAAMMVSLNSLDALIFTGGIGENASLVREKIATLLAIFGFKLDEQKNNSLKLSSATSDAEHTISGLNSKTILVIPTDEESMIVQDTLDLISIK